MYPRQLRRQVRRRSPWLLIPRAGRTTDQAIIEGAWSDLSAIVRGTHSIATTGRLRLVLVGETAERYANVPGDAA
jgi:hypothetical protein